MADPYGLISSGLPPELAAEAMGLKGKQAIMQALLAQSQQPIEAPQVKGRFSAPVSPLQGIAKIAQAYVSSRGLQDADKGYAELGAKYNKGVADALANYEQTKSGTPAKSMAPTTPNDDEGNLNPTVDMPAVPGNPRKAVTDALINPYLNKNPLITSDLKEIQETPKTRTVIQGDQEIQQERQLDGSWKEVGRGPRFAKQIGSTTTIHNAAPVTPVTIQDPNDPNKTIIVDGRTGKTIGKGPKLTDSGKLENKRQFNMQGLGKTIQEAENLLNGIVVEDGVTKSVSKPTGSGIGTAVDYAAGIFGMSPSGSVEAQKMKAIGGALTSKMPRMEGPQSDKDTMLYREMAAMVGDSTVPVDRRKAALQTVKDLWAKYERLNPDAFEKSDTTPSSSNVRVVDW